MKRFKDFSIKAKLMIIFLITKLIPLAILVYLSISGISEFHNFIKESNQKSLEKSIDTVEKAADLAIKDSIEALDKKSQMALENKTVNIANALAEFLYERDNDILFLAKEDNLSKKLFENFLASKTKKVIIPKEFIYDEKYSLWKIKNKEFGENNNLTAQNKDNERYFNYNKAKIFNKKSLKLYKEASFIDLSGKELIKVSALDEDLKNISFKENTYLKAEDYFKEIKKLKEGEIYVSNVIGEYIGSKVFGVFSKEKAKEAGIKFEPQNHAYAGDENPKGKKFQGIVRFISPKFKDGKKIGYVSLALDHTHIMEFSDYALPKEKNELNYSNTSAANYSMLWDNKGRNISHTRDYFIIGYDKNTGKRVKPLLSSDLALKIKKSGIYWEEYLEKYPILENQSLDKKIDLSQVKDGILGLDCRYLNFAPQCSDWMNISKDGGNGSFVTLWNEELKLTTVAAIPYYTGQYAESKRGFGFVTIGANLDEFHKATNKTKNTITEMVILLEAQMALNFEKIYESLSENIKKLVFELSLFSLVIVIVIIFLAIFISNYLTLSLKKLVVGANKFANKEFEHRIKISSKDELGHLGDAFNFMADEINSNIRSLDDKLVEKNKELIFKNKELEDKNVVLEKAKKIAHLGEWELFLDSFESRWSDNVFLMYGLDKNQVSVSSELLESLMFEEDWKGLEDAVYKCIDEKSEFRYTFRIKRADNNKIVWFDCRGKYIAKKNSIIGTIQDITQMKIKEKEIKNYVELVNQNIITSSTNLDGIITHVSDAFCKTCGYTKEELIGKTHSIIKAEDMPKSFYTQMWDTLIEKGVWEGEIKNQKKDKSVYWVKANISAKLDENGKKIGYTAIRQNITDKKIIEEISITDALTSIYNRRHFNEVFPNFVNIAKRDKNTICLAILDIDHFKQYNDTYGHQKGDFVLKDVAKTLNDSLLRADDYCFRLGGEEFALLFKTQDKNRAVKFTNKIKQNIEDLQIEHKNNSASKYVTTSIGLVYIDASQIDDIDKIFVKADELLYKAKESGRNKVIVNN